MVLEKTLESLLDCEEIKPFNPRGKKPLILIGRADDEAEAPVLWPSDVKRLKRPFAKDLDAGQD